MQTKANNNTTNFVTVNVDAKKENKSI
jgi:hypothetical protein